MIVLLPAYRPGPHLLTLIADLRTAAPGTPVIVVDDGSGPAFAPVFADAAGHGCDVLRHPVNRGKGVALKTGFRHAAEAYPGQDVVTADADGQHSVEDILRVGAEARRSGRLVLGVRRFDGDVPWRSRFGNTVTRLLFHAATGRGVADTQTGLRAHPADLLGWLQSVPGERFEYEMNVLLHAARDGHPIDQTVVATTYLDDNAASNFDALSDSVRVYRPLLRYAASALLATAGRGAPR